MNKPTFKNVPNELVTTTDGRKFWISRSVAVVVVLACYDGGKYKFAIEKRGNAPGMDKQGLWCLPCGYLDWNESGTDAAKREVWEEIGLDLNDLIKFEAACSPGLDHPWFVKTEPDENRQNITLRYGMTIIKKDIPNLIPNNDAEPNEIADAKWIGVDEIVNYDFAFDHNKVISEYCRRFIKVY
jgi:8-oxo-dGTP pyrophosphatase MutT (NUDIX family)